MSENAASRRNVIFGVAAAGVAVPILAACGSDSEDTTGSIPTDTPTETPTGSSTSPSAPAESGGIPTSDIPVGGGKIYPDDDMVVTQPKSGEFKAFSATCTHQGCTLANVKDGTINCTCHFSKFSIEDGSVEGGPAPQPLPEKTVTVTGDTLQVS